MRKNFLLFFPLSLLLSLLIPLSCLASPENDDFENAIEITGSEGTIEGDTTEATSQEGEPVHAGDPDDPGATPGASIWYRWTAPANGQVTMDTQGSLHNDTVLAVYTGQTIDALTEIASNDDTDEPLYEWDYTSKESSKNNLNTMGFV
ncbi:hypothetical protein [Desulfobulbus alkaliphilus]|uniref:hypothetical protein n=1 Tax=Desulfobulbus alkaliphilus TaxID=869814 RepID=UPI001962BE8E|nr:hypothetical protein [Desulfobulbus alkaliphilus]MBM9538645.1 hypothetical protein [Desulfobulbus alkaliphilus]